MKDIKDIQGWQHDCMTACKQSHRHQIKWLMINIETSKLRHQSLSEFGATISRAIYRKIEPRRFSALECFESRRLLSEFKAKWSRERRWESPDREVAARLRTTRVWGLGQPWSRHGLGQLQSEAWDDLGRGIAQDNQSLNDKKQNMEKNLTAGKSLGHTL